MAETTNYENYLCPTLTFRNYSNLYFIFSHFPTFIFTLMTVLYEWLKSPDGKHGKEVSNEDKENIQQIKSELQEALNQENTETQEEYESNFDQETDLEKRKQKKIEKFKEKEENTNKDPNSTTHSKKIKNLKKTNRKGFISYDEFNQRKDTEEFTQEIKTFSKSPQNPKSHKKKSKNKNNSKETKRTKDQNDEDDLFTEF
ncbi:hypothetical protein M0813_25097 [Anaeramoeba flamelloides]|uniref:EF-hand domain-containing protein n=1 Tax=Anaeramoeba flamelloides TaxID=1746091 RepID=A0ABQ8Y4N3_9EUKA|nr:hypothetical protein M0813_25097 [Anaeramoeba flamelloides]